VAILQPSGAKAGSADFERPYPPRITALSADATSFYAEFRARPEFRDIGHSYVILGTVMATGEMRETVVAGFMPKTADDDYWAQFGMPVAGLVGVVRSDFLRRPSDVRFRIAITKAQYYRALETSRSLQSTWSTYSLLTQNCNNFAGDIASSLGLRTPMITVQYPVDYIAELRTLNSP
jgi:hypothetical protein